MTTETPSDIQDIEKLVTDYAMAVDLNLDRVGTRKALMSAISRVVQERDELKQQRDSWHKQYCLASEREADCVAKMALMREQYQREIARMAQHGIAKADAARSEVGKP